MVAVTETGREIDKAWAGAAIDTVPALKAAVERTLADTPAGATVEIDTAGFHTAKLEQIAAHAVEVTAGRERALRRVDDGVIGSGADLVAGWLEGSACRCGSSFPGSVTLSRVF